MYRVARRAAYSAQRRALATFVDARAANETYTYRTRGVRFFARATTATTYYILGGLSVSGSLVAAEYMQLRGGSAPRLLARRQASSASAGGAPEPNVSSFLDREREALDAVIAGLTGASITRATGRVFLVIGNQASDADSIVSSLAVARALRAGPLLGLDVRPGDVVIPVVSMKRADWSMRPETHQLMAEAGLDSRVCSGERLVFTDDAADGELFASKTLATLAARDQLRIVLTDHNRSDCAALAPHTAHVAAIVDHHEDLGAHAAVKGGARVVSFDPTEGVQRGVGSACTLIAQLIAAQPGGAVLLSAHGGQLATLLTGVVLLDTVNMDPKMGKATAEDIARHEAHVTASEQARAAWEARGDIHAHSMAHFGDYVFRPGGPLAQLDRGVQARLGKVLYIEAHRQGAPLFADASAAGPLARYARPDAAFLLQVVVPLLLLFLGGTGLASDRVSGRLKLALVQGARAHTVALSRMISI